VLEAWRLAQNNLDFGAYEALYDSGFHGSKRVGERRFDFDRKHWLLDRKPMFTPGLTIGVRKLKLRAGGSLVVASFLQDFATPSFRDTGRKLLAFRREAGTWRIAREDMLTSKVEGGGGSVTALPGFFFARPDAVVLRSEIDERWLTPARRELAQKIRARREASGDEPAEWIEDDFLKPSELTLPPEVTAFAGKTLYVTRAPLAGSHELPPPCEAKVARIVLRNTAKPSFESVRLPAGFDHLYATMVLGLFEKPCPGALWASERAPAAQSVPQPAPAALREAALKALKARGDFPATTVTLLGDPASDQLLFALGSRELPDGSRAVLNLLFQVAHSTPPLRLLGELDPDLVPRLGMDLNADGQLEVLSEPGYPDSTVRVLGLKAGKPVTHPVYFEPEFICPG
jgi:hypothetical protein